MLGQVAEILVEDNVHFLHRGISVTLPHPMVEHSLEVSGCDVTYHLVTQERKDLMLHRTFTTVVGGAFHRWKLEHLEPVGHALAESLMGFI